MLLLATQNCGRANAVLANSGVSGLRPSRRPRGRFPMGLAGIVPVASSVLPPLVSQWRLGAKSYSAGPTWRTS